MQWTSETIFQLDMARSGRDIGNDEPRLSLRPPPRSTKYAKTNQGCVFHSLHAATRPNPPPLEHFCKHDAPHSCSTLSS